MCDYLRGFFDPEYVTEAERDNGPNGFFNACPHGVRYEHVKTGSFDNGGGGFQYEPEPTTCEAERKKMARACPECRKQQSRDQ